MLLSKLPSITAKVSSSATPAVLSPTLTNSFHWGFTRQSFGIVGNTDEQWNTFLGLDQGITYSHNFQVPLHNLVDDISWTKKTHTFQFGAAIGIARDPRTSYLHSNTLGLGTTNWTSPIGFAGTTSTLDPTNVTAHPLINAPEPVTATQYDRPLLALYGMISDVVANYNLDRNGVAQPQGAPVKRNYGLNWYEFYGQDTWRMKPNITLTYGLRWSFFPAPWETNGLQTSPTFGLGNSVQSEREEHETRHRVWRGAADHVQSGRPGKPWSGFLSARKDGLVAPNLHRLLATIWWRPAQKDFRRQRQDRHPRGLQPSLRPGGLCALNSFDQIGAAGLTTTIQNTCCTFGVTSAEDLPRITGINTIPTAESEWRAIPPAAAAAELAADSNG